MSRAKKRGILAVRVIGSRVKRATHNDTSKNKDMNKNNQNMDFENSKEQPNTHEKHSVYAKKELKEIGDGEEDGHVFDLDESDDRSHNCMTTGYTPNRPFQHHFNMNCTVDALSDNLTQPPGLKLEEEKANSTKRPFGIGNMIQGSHVHSEMGIKAQDERYASVSTIAADDESSDPVNRVMAQVHKPPRGAGKKGRKPRSKTEALQDLDRVSNQLTTALGVINSLRHCLKRKDPEEVINTVHKVHRRLPLQLLNGLAKIDGMPKKYPKKGLKKMYEAMAAMELSGAEPATNQ